MKRFLISLLIILYFGSAYPQKSWNGKQLVIKNDEITRVIVLDKGQFSTLSFRLKDYPYNFVSILNEEPTPFNQKGVGNIQEYRRSRGADPEEFSFLLNGEKVTGKTGWEAVGVDENSTDGTISYSIKLRGTSGINNNLELFVTYVVYPGLPLVRKKINFRNTGKEDLSIESLNVESLNVPWGNTHNIIYRNYGRYKHIGPYTGNWDDPLVIVHDPLFHHGIFVGNEAPGVLKQVSVCTDGRILSAGLTHNNRDYAFRKWLKPGERWESTWTFCGLYAGKNPRETVDLKVSDFVRKHMGIRLAQIPERPTFVYNTWKPFRRDVNEELMKELADAASACGVEEFIIDDGWQVGFGDWEIDYNKFPGGLKPVFDYIKAKGMKPGLWLSMGAASKDSKVYREHPEWFAKYRDGDHVNLHTDNREMFSACFTTGWKDYIKDKILNLVKEHGLEYVKLDFAIVASAYRFDPDVSGCFATDHPHRDREESYLEIYRRAWQMYDELHEEAPNLFIDCTFETMGDLQMVDYDMCKHAEGNWLSNFEGEAPYGSARVRQMSWWRSPVIPATALVIGNQSLEDEHSLYSFKSLAGSLPIMLGDPRKVSIEKQKRFREISTWLRNMEKKYQIMLFRQDLPGFGEPSYGGWDGFQRINTETGAGGIIGVFKHFSNVDEQWVTINYLDPGSRYEVIHEQTGAIVAGDSGDNLRAKGFKVRLTEDFQGELYEVRKSY